jgi:hypothetical protein
VAEGYQISDIRYQMKKKAYTEITEDAEFAEKKCRRRRVEKLHSGEWRSRAKKRNPRPRHPPSAGLGQPP